MIFPVIFVALYASHFTLLRLPYYWDEAGYYIPAAWDFFRTGSLIPTSTLTNAHPPLPSIYLALWWKASGFLPEVTREAVLMVASAGAAGGVAAGACGSMASRAVAFWTRGADGALSHLVCAEHAGPCGHLCRGLHLVGTGLCAARSRSKAVGCGGVVYGGGAVEGDGDRDSAHAGGDARSSRDSARARRFGYARCGKRRPGSRAARCRWRRGTRWHYAKTGFLFGNPEFLRYNAQANAGAGAGSGGVRPSHAAPDGAHEHVCADAADDCCADAAAATGCRGTRAAGNQRSGAVRAS